MNQPSQTGDTGGLSVTKAILVGHAISTVPVFVIIFGFRQIGISLLGRQWWIFLIIGFLIAWAWWAYITPRWKKWAVQKGAPAEKLHQAAVATGLEWQKGAIFEKTELKPKDRE